MAGVTFASFCDGESRVDLNAVDVSAPWSQDHALFDLDIVMDLI